MASPYLLWHYFNLMQKQARDLPQPPVTDLDQQILLNSHQANIANLNYQHLQQLQTNQYIQPTSSNPFRGNIPNSHAIIERSQFNVHADISNLRNRQKLYPEYFDNARTFRDHCQRTKSAISPKSKQNKESNHPHSPRRALFTIDAILSKDHKNKTSQISLSPASNISHAPTSSLSEDLDATTPNRSETPPCSPCRSEACSPVQDHLCSRPQPLMHSTPQQYNPNLNNEFGRDGFVPLHHHSHIYPLPRDPNIQIGHIDDNQYSTHIGNINNCTSHLHSEPPSQNQYHHQQHEHQHYHQLASQCLSSSASESASASCGSTLSSTCSDMSTSNSSSNSNQKSSSEKQSRKSGTKSKRVRTIFTPVQLERLEAEFERQQYMVGTERFYLANSLSLSEAQVKVWFQNRRIKWRKQHLEQQQARLAKGGLYRDLGPLEDEEELDQSHGESDMEEEHRAEPQSVAEIDQRQ